MISILEPAERKGTAAIDSQQAPLNVSQAYPLAFDAGFYFCDIANLWTIGRSATGLTTSDGLQLGFIEVAQSYLLDCELLQFLHCQPPSVCVFVIRT